MVFASAQINMGKGLAPLSSLMAGGSTRRAGAHRQTYWCPKAFAFSRSIFADMAARRVRERLTQKIRHLRRMSSRQYATSKHTVRRQCRLLEAALEAELPAMRRSKAQQARLIESYFSVQHRICL